MKQNVVKQKYRRLFIQSLIQLAFDLNVVIMNCFYVLELLRLFLHYILLMFIRFDFLVDHRGDSYNLFDHNCNTFSNEVAQFLTGRKIPSYITDLPSEVLAT